MQYKTITFRPPISGTDLPQHETLRVFSFDEYVPGSWEEYAISNCPMGCKVYRSLDNGVELVLMHNSNYNCRR